MSPNRVTEISINSSDLSVISENVLAAALSRIKSVKLDLSTVNGSIQPNEKVFPDERSGVK